jgi:DNA repair protein RadD
MKLRKYQALMLSQLWAALFYSKNALCVAATGSGKTRIFSELLKIGIDRKENFKALVIVHRVSLVKQTVKAFEKFIPNSKISIFCETLQKKDLSGQIVVSTFQSLVKSDKVYKEYYNLTILDECHNLTFAVENSFEKLREINPSLKVIGFTATPFTREGYLYGTGKFFEEISVSIPMKKMMEMGYLSPYTLKSSATKFDMSTVTKPKRMDDYLPKELNKLTKDEKKINDQVEDMLSRVSDRKKIAVLTINIEHCEQVASQIRHFEDALVQHSKSPYNLNKFMESDTRFLISVNQLSEGFDYPAIDCVVFMRPTRSAKFMVQAVGRGLRTCEGKTDCLVLDYGDVFLHCGTPEEPLVIERSYSNRQKEVEPTLKVCPECQAYVFQKDKNCGECGYEFKARPSLKNINTKPAFDISFIQSPKTRAVSYMKYEPDYIAKSGKNVPRVIFYTDWGSTHKYLFSDKQRSWFEWQSKGGKIKPDFIKLDDPTKRFPNVELVFDENNL